ncbi:hypothetical protein QBC46DRAFT_376070 [Diplogelasinospora grovesii]|uniref:Uncharacterized protein n=1 Tax=Diplogelasinospora grovesii TaxID=303347 RepID=A0AAN6NFS5_9PEZI|nr:hypothetical protein QBC46DRAFT_376070 [Diplogelasinospora grovesii]
MPPPFSLPFLILLQTLVLQIPSIPIFLRQRHLPVIFLPSLRVDLTMCFYEQTRWRCGFWKWGNFRQQCTKEYRIGKTCGLKLVFETGYRQDACKLCGQIAKKQRRLAKMTQDIERWKRDGNRPATVEKTESDLTKVRHSISRILEQHTRRT